MFEDFTLSTNIATTCEGTPVNNPTRGTCSVEGTGGVAIFSGTMGVCDYTPEQMGGVEDMWDGLCYHVPSEEHNLFNS